MQKYKELLEATFEFEGLLSLAINRNPLSDTLRELISQKGERLIKLVDEIRPLLGKDENEPDPASSDKTGIKEGIPASKVEETASSTLEITEKNEPAKDEAIVEISKPVQEMTDEASEEKKEIKEATPEKKEDKASLREKLEKLGLIGGTLSSKSKKSNGQAGVSASEEKKAQPAKAAAEPHKNSEEVPKNTFDSFYVIEDDDDEEEIPARPTRKSSSGSTMRKKPVFSLNDRFLFIRELFGGDASKFNMVVERSRSFENFKEAKDYLMREYLLDAEKETDGRFLQIVEDVYKQA